MTSAVLVALLLCTAGDGPVPQEFRSARMEQAESAGGLSSRILDEEGSISVGAEAWGVTPRWKNSRAAITLSAMGADALGTAQTMQRLTLFRSTPLATIALDVGHTIDRTRLTRQHIASIPDSSGLVWDTKSLLIDWSDREAGHLGVDASFRAGEEHSVLLAIGGSWGRPRGFSYNEDYDGHAGIAQIRYCEYDEGAWQGQGGVHIGLRGKMKRARHPAHYVLSAKWDMERFSSLPVPVEGIRPYFYYPTLELAPTIQFWGEEGSTHYFGIRAAFGHDFADRAPFDSQRKGVIHPRIDKASIQVMSERAQSTITNVNRWERDGRYYWGVTDRRKQDYSLVLSTAANVRCYFLEHGFIGLDYSSDKRMVPSSDATMIMMNWHVMPEVGFKIGLGKRRLLEAGGSAIDYRPSMQAHWEDFDNWALYDHGSRLLRPQAFVRFLMLE